MIVPASALPLTTRASAVMRMIVPENHRRRCVYDEAQYGHDDGFGVGDWNWLKNSLRTLPGHHQRKQDEQHSAGKPAEGVDFAGAETEAAIMGVLPGEDVSRN